MSIIKFLNTHLVHIIHGLVICSTVAFALLLRGYMCACVMSASINSDAQWWHQQPNLQQPGYLKSNEIPKKHHGNFLLSFHSFRSTKFFFFFRLPPLHPTLFFISSIIFFSCKCCSLSLKQLLSSRLNRSANAYVGYCDCRLILMYFE